MGEETDSAARLTTVLLSPGVYATDSAAPQTTQGPSNVTTVPAEGRGSSTAVTTSTSMDRFDKHRRLRRAMAAKEATLMELTRLIMNNTGTRRTGSSSARRKIIGGIAVRSPGGVGSTAGGIGHSQSSTTPLVPMAAASTVEGGTVAAAAAAASAPLGDSVTSAANDAEIRYIQSENKRLRAKEATHAKEQARLESLVYDLRRELEVTGHALRDQTAAMKTVGVGLGRMDPHRMVKTQREQQAKSLTSVELPEDGADSQRDLQAAREKAKILEGLLVAEQERCEHAEKRCADLQAALLRSSLMKTPKAVNEDHKDGSATELSFVDDNKDMAQRAALERRVRTLKAKEHTLMGSIQGLEETHRAARRSWGAKEKEFKRYIQILEATITRMERRMPMKKPNTATLFNVTLRLVACEGLLNRRNNGVGFIDPFVVVYGPCGEKALETLPRTDTTCPQFITSEDAVMLKVARGSPWSIVFEVYSRGANNARLFLGQAQVPLGPLLEDSAAGAGVRHSAKLHPREREPDGEIVQHAHHLGTVVFTAAAAVAGNTAAAVACRGSMSDTGRLFSPKRDGEKAVTSDDTSESAACCSASTNGVTIRVVSANGILRRDVGVNSNPYVVAYDGSGGEELLRLPPVLETTEPSWENCSRTIATLSGGEPYGCIIFHVYDYDRDGKDEFLGEARLAKKKLYSDQEWHELTLHPRVDEPLQYIRDHRHRLGRLLVQCTRREKECVSEGNEVRQREEPHRGETSCSPFKPLGPSESSVILYNEPITPCGDVVLKSYPVQVSVEACKDLGNVRGKGSTFVRILSPDAKVFLTSAVPLTRNPSWSKGSGSTIMSLHPLDSGVIGFHVMGSGNAYEAREQRLGYAQLSVSDLFRHGFSKKELRLSIFSCGTDRLFRQRDTNLGSIVVSFVLLNSHPVQGNTESEKVDAERNISTATTAEPPREEPVVSSSSLPEEVVISEGPTTACMHIYVKEGHDLLDCDQEMFNVLGVTDPRVMVWIGPDHAFTVPEKRDTVNPKWNQEEGEFIVSVQSSHIIRFEVQDVDVAGFDSMGCATIHASEAIASPGEHELPVMLHGKQYGTLSVVFTPDSKNKRDNGGGV